MTLPALLLSFTATSAATVFVEAAELALASDGAHLVIAGEVYADGECSKSCDVDVFLDDGTGFSGEGIVGDGGVMLYTGGLAELHIGQAGVQVKADKSSVQITFEDDLVEPLVWLDWGRYGAGIAAVDGLSGKGDTWVVTSSELVGLAPESMTVAAPDAAAVALSDLSEKTLAVIDPLDLVFESPLEPAYLEKALAAMGY